MEAFFVGALAGQAALLVIAIAITFWPEKRRRKQGRCGVSTCDQPAGHWQQTPDREAAQSAARAAPPDTTAQRETEKEQK